MKRKRLIEWNWNVSVDYEPNITYHLPFVLLLYFVEIFGGRAFNVFCLFVLYIRLDTPQKEEKKTNKKKHSIYPYWCGRNIGTKCPNPLYFFNVTRSHVSNVAHTHAKTQTQRNRQDLLKWDVDAVWLERFDQVQTNSIITFDMVEDSRYDSRASHRNVQESFFVPNEQPQEKWICVVKWAEFDAANSVNR